MSQSGSGAIDSKLIRQLADLKRQLSEKPVANNEDTVWEDLFTSLFGQSFGLDRFTNELLSLIENENLEQQQRDYFLKIKQQLQVVQANGKAILKELNKLQLPDEQAQRAALEGYKSQLREQQGLITAILPDIEQAIKVVPDKATLAIIGKKLTTIGRLGIIGTLSLASSLEAISAVGVGLSIGLSPLTLGLSLAIAACAVAVGHYLSHLAKQKAEQKLTIPNFQKDTITKQPPVADDGAGPGDGLPPRRAPSGP